MKKYIILFTLLITSLGISQTTNDSEDVNIYDCSINKHDTHFKLDSLTSGVKISFNEAYYQSKNGLTNDDLRIYDYFDLEKQPLVDGIKINLEELQIGTLFLYNIVATIVRDQEIPLIIGKKIIDKIGNVNKIDNKFIFSKIPKDSIAPIKIDMTNEEFKLFRRNDLIEYANFEYRQKPIRDLQKNVRGDEKNKELRVLLTMKVDIVSAKKNDSEYNQDILIEQRMASEKIIYEAFKSIMHSKESKLILDYYEKINFIIGFAYLDKTTKLTHILTKEKLKNLTVPLKKDDLIEAIDFAK